MIDVFEMQKIFNEVQNLIPLSGKIPRTQREKLEAVVEILRKLKAYWEIGTVEECRKAVEKQRAKEIIIRNWHPTKCPTCNYELSTSLGDGYYKHPTFLKRCPECGQAIKWEESEEE